VSRTVTALLSGIVFGAGLAISGMTNPAKVLGFFDVLGAWDPSLALVMGGALAVSLVGFWLMRGREHTVLGEPMVLPAGGSIDLPLIGGAVVYGVGWGLTGFCIGPALAAAAWLDARVFVFLVALLVGMGMVKGGEARSSLAKSPEGRGTE